MYTNDAAPAEAKNLPKDVQEPYDDYVEAAAAHIETLSTGDALFVATALRMVAFGIVCKATEESHA